MTSISATAKLNGDEPGNLVAGFSSQVAATATTLASIGNIFYQKDWVLGTSGNFSAIISRDPFVLMITTSGAHKGELSAEDFLCLDADYRVMAGLGKPSAETLIHQAIIRERGAGAILHTHSMWATILSELYSLDGGFAIEGYEMLKGLSGVRTHQHREWLPILANSQDYESLAAETLHLLRSRPDIHGILLQGHGLYTWGAQIQEARRHVEILEFLMAVSGTKLAMKPTVQQ
jgi:methylthioribulose-1-phosphate dehydratase